MEKSKQTDTFRAEGKVTDNFRLSVYIEQRIVSPHPKKAEYLLYLVLPKEERDLILGDLEEDFHEVERKFGLKKANIFYWSQVFRSLWPLVAAGIKKLVYHTIRKFTVS